MCMASQGLCKDIQRKLGSKSLPTETAHSVKPQRDTPDASLLQPKGVAAQSQRDCLEVPGWLMQLQVPGLEVQS